MLPFTFLRRFDMARRLDATGGGLLTSGSLEVSVVVASSQSSIVIGRQALSKKEFSNSPNKGMESVLAARYDSNICSGMRMS